MTQQGDADDLIALGKVVTNGVLAEYLTRELLLGFVSADRRVGDISVGRSSWDQMIDRIRLFADVLADADVAHDLRAWAQAAHDCRKRRNDVIHSPWVYPDDETGIRHRLDVRKRTLHKQEVSDLDALVRALGDLVESTPSLASRLGACQEWHGDPDAFAFRRAGGGTR